MPGAEVQIRTFGDELRAGFTDDRAALLRRRRMTFDEEHAFNAKFGRTPS